MARNGRKGEPKAWPAGVDAYVLTLVSCLTQYQPCRVTEEWKKLYGSTKEKMLKLAIGPLTRTLGTLFQCLAADKKAIGTRHEVTKCFRSLGAIEKNPCELQVIGRYVYDELAAV